MMNLMSHLKKNFTVVNDQLTYFVKTLNIAKESSLEKMF